MEQQGWVKFYREWLDNPYICKDGDHMAVWMYLMLNATHKEKQVNFGKQVITLKVGQLLTSQREIAEKLKINRGKVDRIFALFKSVALIVARTNMQQSIVTIELWDTSQNESVARNMAEVWHECGTEQETENEKEKRSKREKDKEKEKNKNERMKEYIHPSLSPQGEKGREDFSLPSGKSLFSSDKEAIHIPKTEEELDRWLCEDDGIDEWDKVQIYYRNLNSRQQLAGSSQQDSYAEDNEADSFALANPIQQEKEERSNPQPQTPSPFAKRGDTPPSPVTAGEHLPQATSQPPLTVKGGEPRSGGGFAEATPQLHCEALHLNKVQHRSEKDLEEFFGLFWQAYPKKVGKGYAFDCFKKIRVSRSLLDTMLEAIAKQKKSDMWKRDKGQYIPNPSTWLNQKRWEDDLDGETDSNPWSSFKLGIEL